MPLYFKPKAPLALTDVMDAMRDHYEGTPFDITTNAGAGTNGAPYRPSPLTWEYQGKKYFNERPVSTHQASFVIVAQLRGNLPNPVGGVLWFANDEANTTPFVPIYCSLTKVPECFDDATANDHTFSWKSAFWLCNWVSNMVYPRYDQLYPTVAKRRDHMEEYMLNAQKAADASLLRTFQQNPSDFSAEVNGYAQEWANILMTEGLG